MSGPQTKHVRAPRASEAARAGASPVGPATARLLRRPAGPRTLVLSPTQAFAGTAPVCRERRPRRQPTSTLRFAGRRQDTFLRLLGTAHLRRKAVATRWRAPRDLVSNQVEMSSPWCGGGLPGPPRMPRNTGQARGLDAKPGRPAAGRVTAPLQTTRARGGEAALPLGDGALDLFADMPVPRMVRSRPRTRRRRPGGAQRLGRQVPAAVAQSAAHPKDAVRRPSASPAGLLPPRPPPAQSARRRSSSGRFDLRPRSRWTAAPSPSASNRRIRRRKWHRVTPSRAAPVAAANIPSSTCLNTAMRSRSLTLNSTRSSPGSRSASDRT